MGIKMKTIELIVPCYNEEKCIELFYNAVKEVFRKLPAFHFIITYVDDGSRDDTLNEVKRVVESAKEGWCSISPSQETLERSLQSMQV